MATRKVYVEVKVNVIFEIEEGIELSEVMSDLSINSDTEETEVIDFEILNYEVTDSK